MKYIVKNCSKIREETYYDVTDYTCNYSGFCRDCDNCLTKNVINECNKVINKRQNLDDYIPNGYEMYDFDIHELNGQTKLARRILNLFEIESMLDSGDNNADNR